MKQITSRENSLYKELKLLATSSQVRRKAGRTLLDGVHLCEAYQQHLKEEAELVPVKLAEETNH